MPEQTPTPTSATQIKVENPTPQAPPVIAKPLLLDDWRAIVDRVRAADAGLASALEHAVPIEISRARVSIGYAQDDFLGHHASEEASVAKLTHAVHAHFGAAVPIQGRAGVITIPQPAHLDGVGCTPRNVLTPGGATCTLTLSAPAAAGMTFKLSSPNPNLTIPGSVSVPAGGKGATFNIQASAVSTIAMAPLNATFATQSLSTTVILAPPGGGVSTAAIVNAANYASGPVAPGGIVSIWGSGMGPSDGASLQLESGRVATKLAGVRVLFDGVPAPLLYVASDQINTVVPYGVAGRPSTQLQVEYLGALSKALTVPVAAASPGVFTVDASGTGQGAILNQDFGINLVTNPAEPSSIVMIYATGEGPVNPRPADGSITGTAVLPKPVGKVTVSIGGSITPGFFCFASKVPVMS
jgi:uncharacterized protein (TIGR03437 family)